MVKGILIINVLKSPWVKWLIIVVTNFPQNPRGCRHLVSTLCSICKLFSSSRHKPYFLIMCDETFIPIYNTRVTTQDYNMRMEIWKLNTIAQRIDALINALGGYLPSSSECSWCERPWSISSPSSLLLLSESCIKKNWTSLLVSYKRIQKAKTKGTQLVKIYSAHKPYNYFKKGCSCNLWCTIHVSLPAVCCRSKLSFKYACSVLGRPSLASYLVWAFWGPFRWKNPFLSRSQ